MKSLRHIFKRLRCMKSNCCEKLHGDWRNRYKCMSVQHAICRALLFTKPRNPIKAGLFLAFYVRGGGGGGGGGVDSTQHFGS